MAEFDINKVFKTSNMPLDVQMEICEEVGDNNAVRIFLTGYNRYPLTRKWLLKNGAEKSDKFVYVWIEW